MLTYSHGTQSSGLRQKRSLDAWQLLAGQTEILMFSALTVSFSVSVGAVFETADH